MTDTTIKGVAPAHLLWAAGIVIIGLIGIVYGGTMAWADIKSSLNVVIIKQDKTDLRMDKLEANQRATDTKVDTIGHRQEINNITNNYRFQMQQQRRNPLRWYTEHKATPLSTPVLTVAK